MRMFRSFLVGVSVGIVILIVAHTLGCTFNITVLPNVRLGTPEEQSVLLLEDGNEEVDGHDRRE